MAGLGAGPMEALAASGAPSRWLRVRSKVKYLAKDFYQTPAEEKQLQSFHAVLASKGDLDARVKAAESLTSLARGERMAWAICENLGPLLQCLKAKEAPQLKLAVLGTLRVLTENNQAMAVAQHSYALLPCLRDEDILVQRKVSSLYRVLAEEGQAAMIARDVASIMHCFEATQAVNASLMAPLDALTAIASAGEGRAVARVVERLLAALRDGRAKIRATTCKTLAAIARGGAKELLGHLGLIDAEIAESCISGVSLFEMLALLSLDDPDADVRLAAADALRCLPEAEISGESAHEKRNRYPALVKRLQRWAGSATGEVQTILLSVFYLSQDTEACVICQEALHLDGGPEALPCGHVFHRRCMEDWYLFTTKCGRTPNCPMCRTKMPNINILASPQLPLAQR
ncbi:sel-11 [Symbiodinium natans]|uniref:Sel-11 protein n=1 Tax=Symbiodinium natans TaxID=878477 RepID=A0A812UP09_9DINO|nr:sel-11 [Symbiodinium natans]